MEAPNTIDECIAIIHRDLPGWWWTVGLCNLTGHASIGPDYNGPDRARLLAAFPVDLFDAGFDADLAPGGSLQAACDALMDCHQQAIVAISALPPPKREEAPPS